MERKCSICGKLISNKSKSGMCGKCYNKYGKFGENNPFYGKKHKKETIDAMKIKCSEASKKLWENEEYRNKVIANTTGLKRSEEFKQTQREHAIKQFKDENQRLLRSKMMKENWQNGTIVKNHYSSNTSKQEQLCIALLNEQLKQYNIQIKQNECIKYINEQTNRKRHLFPDGLISEYNIIIEYYGSLWHADPKYYKETDIVHRNVLAKDIWKENDDRIKLLNKLGYNVIIVWQSDFQYRKDDCINKTVTKIKELCKL